MNIRGRIRDLQPNDFWEGIDKDGNPFDDDGVVLSDPGHALECIGLILKFTGAAKSAATEDQAREIRDLEQQMPGILAHMFDVGFHDAPGGICKAYDLVTRKPLNSDVPWWSLPETMRTAAFCSDIAETEASRKAAYRILGKCHNAFTKGFVRRDLHLMAYQTLSAAGKVIPVIPATADADPGYHTGLSIIDMLEVIEGG
jgi:mannose/cellobiose epimerase-like protein (N-acyl-D-glucosamine 2-epimerase family)